MAVRRAHGTSGDHPHGSTSHGGINEVTLVGRVPAEPVERELPSGDVMVTFRVVVTRPGGPRTGTARAGAGGDGVSGSTPARIGVDTIDCAAWTARTRKSAQRVAGGDTVEVKGALRRRFWRSAAGPASRTEVEVASLRVLDRAGRVRPLRAGAAGPPVSVRAADA